MISTPHRPQSACQRRHMNMFYLIDTSGSMNYNNCIQSVNNAMNESITILRDIATSNYDNNDIYIQCATFADDARWLYDQAVSVRDFQWTDIHANGLTNFKAALDLLEKQLHRETGLGTNTRHLRPAVILLSDGDPDPDWEPSLERLQQNPWFRQAYKIAIAVGCKPENQGMQQALTAFTEPLDSGGENIIINVQDKNMHKLYDVIKFVSSTVSRLGSRNLSGDNSVSAQIHEHIFEHYTVDKDDTSILVSGTNPAANVRWF